MIGRIELRKSEIEIVQPSGVFMSMFRSIFELIAIEGEEEDVREFWRVLSFLFYEKLLTLAKMQSVDPVDHFWKLFNKIAICTPRDDDESNAALDNFLCFCERLTYEDLPLFLMTEGEDNV